MQVFIRVLKIQNYACVYKKKYFRVKLRFLNQTNIITIHLAVFKTFQGPGILAWIIRYIFMKHLYNKLLINNYRDCGILLCISHGVQSL